MISVKSAIMSESNRKTIGTVPTYCAAIHPRCAT